MNDNVAKVTTSIDSLVGERIRDIRKSRAIGLSEFGSRMRELVGAGWSRQAVWQVEGGKKACSTADLIAAAQVLGCTVADLTSSSEPVTLGGAQPLRTDALVRGASAAPEIEGWARFTEAGEALNDVRNAWERYKTALDVVRNRAGQSAQLRERIEAFHREAHASLRDELADVYGFRPPPGFDLDEYMSVNLTPAMVVARDALSSYSIPHRPWSAGRPKKASK